MNPLAYPAHAGHSHRIAEGLVARAVSGQLVAVRDERVVVGEAHQTLTLDGRKTPNGGGQPC